MFCNQCGSEIPPGYTVCPLCNPNVARPQPMQPPPPAPGPFAPPGPAPYNAGPYAQPPGAPQPYYQPGAYAPTTNGFAIASLVCAFVGCIFGLPWILGVIFGIVAISQINNSNGTQKGKGLAIAGIAISGAMIALGLLYIVAMIFFAASGSFPTPTP